MTSFFPSGLDASQDLVRQNTEKLLCKGRDKKRTVLPEDQLFISVCVMKHGEAWKFDAHVHSRKVARFEPTITKFIKDATFLLFKRLGTELSSIMNVGCM